MSSQPIRILMADDDDAYCQLIKKTLTNYGYSITICHTAEESFKIIQEQIIDLILLDYKMEGTNGINVLQWMFGKKIKKPVILITNYGSDEIYEEAYKWGASEYFIKGEMDTVRLPALIEQVYSKYSDKKL